MTRMTQNIRDGFTGTNLFVSRGRSFKLQELFSHERGRPANRVDEKTAATSKAMELEVSKGDRKDRGLSRCRRRRKPKNSVAGICEHQKKQPMIKVHIKI
jgi:transcription termination factor NusB